MKNFESQIKKMLETELSFESKSRLKADLMHDLDNKGFLESLRLGLKSVSFSASSKALLKEKLLLLVERKSSFQENLLSFFTFSSKFAFGTLASFLVLTLLLNPYSQMRTVKASAVSKIQTFEGEVLITRDGLEHFLQDEIILKKGDHIETKENSSLTIVFADSSLMRLSENTELVLSDLTKDDSSLQVEIDLKQGKAWNNLIGLKKGGASFTFATDELEGNISTTAIFDLEAKDSYSRVVNFSKDVVFTLPDRDKELVLSKGDLLKVSADDYEVDLDSVLQEKDLEWIQDNLQKDIDYSEELVRNLLEERKDKAGTVPGSVWYPVEELGRSAKLAVTLDPVKKDKVKLEIANEKLMEAEVLLDEGKDPAELLEEYQATIEEVAGNIDKLKVESFEEADELNQDLKMVLESSILEVVDEEILPENNRDSIVEAVEKAKEKVNELQDVKEDESETEDKEKEEKLPLKLDAKVVEERSESLSKDKADTLEILEELEEAAEVVDPELESDLEYKVLDEKETGDLLVELEADGVKLDKVELEVFELDPSESKKLEEDDSTKVKNEVKTELEAESKIVEEAEAYHESAENDGKLVQELVMPMVRE